jgi:hypothetical protein
MADLSENTREGFKIFIIIFAARQAYKFWKKCRAYGEKKESEQGGKPYNWLKDEDLNKRVKKLLLIAVAISTILVTLVLLFAR